MRVILVSYAKGHVINQVENRKTFANLKSFFPVYEKVVINEDQYREFVKRFWDQGNDMIIIEGDKVASISLISELLLCPKTHCCFPYAIKKWFVTRMSYWRKNQIQTLGFVKFSSFAQSITPVSEWANFTSGYGIHPLDASIEYPLFRKLGKFHLHEKFVRHNDLRGLTISD